MENPRFKKEDSFYCFYSGCFQNRRKYSGSVSSETSKTSTLKNNPGRSCRKADAPLFLPDNCRRQNGYAPRRKNSGCPYHLADFSLGNSLLEGFGAVLFQALAAVLFGFPVWISGGVNRETRACSNSGIHERRLQVDGGAWWCRSDIH